MELAGLIQHHLDGVLILAEFVSFALLASTRSPRGSLNSGHLLGAVLVVTALIFPLAVPITVVMSSLAGCRLRLASGWRWLNVLHSCCGVGGSVLVRYRHEIRHRLRLGSVELVLQ
jgi:hypothetical protein